MSVDPHSIRADGSERDEQLQSVIAECIRSSEAGRPPVHQDLIEKYPEFAAELKQFFVQRDQMNQLADPIQAFKDDLFQATLDAPNWLARFTDLTPHARGGIGEVFRATDPQLHRTVAIKYLQERQAENPHSRQRFLLEAEVTARLEHPGVVPVYGLVGGGVRPGYAMRFVEGNTFAGEISSYYAGPPDSVAFRRLVQAFLQVCQTVAYAHSRGVIHRDLKPANVMIGKFGETLVVDWGLAKVVGRPEEIRAIGVGETLVPASSDSVPGETAMGFALGTPEYMSPEQAAGRWDVVAQPSDVYGLGAVLYTLLTGKPPLEPGNWPQMQQRIQQGEFPRPRQVNPKVPWAIQAICLKAMAIKPEDRYSSATALGVDVEHWLADEPVTAYSESVAARIRRWGKRHRTLVSAAGVLVFAAVVGLSIGAFLLQRAGVEIDNQRKVAVTAQRKSEAINRFLIDDLLKQADPVNNPVGEKLTVRELLDKAADRLDMQTNLADQPEVEAELREVIGHAYEYLVVNDKAERHFRRAWVIRSSLSNQDAPDTLRVRNRYVRALTTQGPRPDAQAIAREAYADCKRIFGDEHIETAEAMNNLAEVYFHLNRFDEVISLRREASRIAHIALGPDDEKTQTIDNDLGIALVFLGRPAEAIPVYQSLVDRWRKLNPRYSELPSYLSNLGGAQIAFGRFLDAESVLRESVALGTELLGADNGSTLMNINLLSYALEGQERWTEAETKYLAVLADRRRVRGPTHHETQRTLAFMTRMYAKQEKWPDMARYLSELRLAQKPELAQTLVALTAESTVVFGEKYDPTTAAPVLLECYAAVEERMWKGDWLVAELHSRYGDCLRRQGKYAEAEPILLESAAAIRIAVGVPGWGVAASRKRVEDLYEAMTNPTEAAKWR